VWKEEIGRRYPFVSKNERLPGETGRERIRR
jgi:hypothetical protein